jgi:hypothetical protein
MDGDYVLPPKKWDIVARFNNWRQQKKLMPENPIGHPDCIEIIEGGDSGPARVIYRRT